MKIETHRKKDKNLSNKNGMMSGAKRSIIAFKTPMYKYSGQNAFKTARNNDGLELVWHSDCHFLKRNHQMKFG